MDPLRCALDEDVADQGLEGLCQRRVRDAGLVLVELAGREEATRRNKHLMQLVPHRGFSDARITGYESELWRILSPDPIERRKQSIDLVLPPVQLLRCQQSVRRVVRAQREWINATMRLPFCQAPPKIGFEAGGSLVALLGVPGEELHDDGTHRLGACVALPPRPPLLVNMSTGHL